MPGAAGPPLAPSRQFGGPFLPAPPLAGMKSQTDDPTPHKRGTESELTRIQPWSGGIDPGVGRELRMGILLLPWQRGGCCTLGLGEQQLRALSRGILQGGQGHRVPGKPHSQETVQRCHLKLGFLQGTPGLPVHKNGRSASCP